MRALLFLAATLPGLAVAQPIDTFPVLFLPGGASAEGCHAQWSTRSAVQAYTAPTAVSEQVRTIDAQRRIDANDYSESLTAVVRTGLIRARQPIEFEVYGADGRAERVGLRPGEEVEILGPAGEGAVYLSYEGDALVGFIPGGYDPDSGVDRVRDPITEVWVRLVDHGAGRPASWVNTSQAGMVEREAFCE